MKKLTTVNHDGVETKYVFTEKEKELIILLYKNSGMHEKMEELKQYTDEIIQLGINGLLINDSGNLYIQGLAIKYGRYLINMDRK